MTPTPVTKPAARAAAPPKPAAAPRPKPRISSGFLLRDRPRSSLQPRRRRQRLDAGRVRSTRSSGARLALRRRRRGQGSSRSARRTSAPSRASLRRPAFCTLLGCRDREAPRRGRDDVLRHRRWDDRAGRRPGTAMSEAAAQPAAGRELYVRHARLEGRSVARLRAVDQGDRCVVEAEVWPSAEREQHRRRPVLVSEPGRGDTLRHARGRGAHSARRRRPRVVALRKALSRGQRQRPRSGRLQGSLR